MSAIDFLIFLAIAAIIGGVAAALMGIRGMGCAWYIVFGFLGAIVGRYLASFFGLPEFMNINAGGYTFPLVWSLLGGLLVVGLYVMLSRRRTYL